MVKTNKKVVKTVKKLDVKKVVVDNKVPAPVAVKVPTVPVVNNTSNGTTVKINVVKTITESEAKAQVASVEKKLKSEFRDFLNEFLVAFDAAMNLKMPIINDDYYKCSVEDYKGLTEVLDNKKISYTTE